MRLGVARALVAGALVAGEVRIEDGHVAEVGVSPAGRDGTAVPGFVDLQVNGFAGVDLLHAEPEAVQQVARELARHGVTAFQPTLITAPPQELERALRTVAASAGPGPRILGAHLEGPFLSPAWPGAHPPEHLRPPDPRLVERLLAAGPVHMVTLAPELDGGLDLVRALTASGVVVSIGHTDADASTAHAAFDAGARALTHVHNAHRRFAHRDPGPAGVALTRDDATVMAIVDGVHLAPETARLAHLAARDRLCLVSDLVAGPSRDGDGRLRGSDVPLDGAVRELRRLGASLVEASHAASRAPALLIRRPDLGTIEPGAPADIAILDDDGAVLRTLVAGVEAR